MKTATLIFCIVLFAAGLGAAALVRRFPADPDTFSPVVEPKRGTRNFALAEKHFQVGLSALRSERYSEALAAFERAASCDDTDPRPHHGMGEALRKMVLVDRAEIAYRKAIEIDPAMDASKKSLAQLLHDRGRYEESTRMLRDLHAKNPKDASLLGELAINAIALDRPGEAIELLEQYNASIGRQAWGLVRLGEALEASGDVARAERVYREALGIDPTFTSAYYSLGQLLAAAGERNESERLLKTHRQLRALETQAHQLGLELLRDANNVDTLMRLAQARVRLGKAPAALLLIERARALRPNDRSIQAIYEKVRQSAGTPR